jgi:hypothetical protein
MNQENCEHQVKKKLLEITAKCISIHPSVYGAKAPSGPWPPSYDDSIHPYLQVCSSISERPMYQTARPSSTYRSRPRDL